MSHGDVPTATYRLQFNPEFGFRDASALVPYLHQLGVSHIYASPFLKARAGSAHGYDIVDHNALNPELGSEADFHDLVQTLRAHDMGLIMDIVPNHMGVGGNDNSWWLDVLEHGEASPYAGYFDIDWRPVNPALHNKLLLPFLGDHYGIVLERGELTLEFSPEHGRFKVSYYDHDFLIDPRTYVHLLAYRNQEFTLRADAELNARLRDLINACRDIPRRTELTQSQRHRRRHQAAACQQQLAQACREYPVLQQWLEENVAQLNGSPGKPRSFDRLHRLLDNQAYRLAYWKVAADEINYRRFFDINDLAGLRMENREVFEATHRCIGRLLHDNLVDGLRVDHVDGLSDPGAYCQTLQALLQGTFLQGNESERKPYLVVEKILAGYERLPRDWPINGTTGYDFAELLNGLFVFPGGEKSLTREYRHFTGRDNESGNNWPSDFDRHLYESKKFVIRHALSSELTVLANLLSTIAHTDRSTRDFTYQGLRDALGEVVACFPVYRTYNNRHHCSEEDQRYIHWAVEQAKKRSPAGGLIFEFIHGMLLLHGIERRPLDIQRRCLAFSRRFQQYTATIAAKGMEDTAFYRYPRLVSLNDVGFDPRSFGTSPERFHRENERRLEEWPQAMTDTSTHDSKRGEDVRARINVISELGETWRRQVRRWRRINRGKKKLVDDRPAPSGADEYLLYQTLIGTWPLNGFNDNELADYRERIKDYMLKAVREAKRYTSWINPNEEYEQGLGDFIDQLLDSHGSNAFQREFSHLQEVTAYCGLLNGLSQTLLKLAAPGVPDIYQGNELWAFSLVDPDNRRPVDYHHRRALLDSLPEPDAALARELLATLPDGRAKLYATRQALRLRRNYPLVFQLGGYEELSVAGERSAHLCAFARRHEQRQVIVVAARWFADLLDDDNRLPSADQCWRETWVDAPQTPLAANYTNILCGTTVSLRSEDESQRFSVPELLADFPVALLVNQ